MDEYETLLKSLAGSIRVADEAAKSGSLNLADKLRFHKLRKDLETASRLVRRNYYEYEDALAVPVEHCPECQQQTS